MYPFRHMPNMRGRNRIGRLLPVARGTAARYHRFATSGNDNAYAYAEGNGYG